MEESFRRHAIYISHDNIFRIRKVAPERLWDPEDQVFLRPGPYVGYFCPVVLAVWLDNVGLVESVLISLVVLCHNSSGVPRIPVVTDASVLTKLWETIFDAKHQEHSISPHELAREIPGINWMRYEGGLELSELGHRIHISNSRDIGINVSKKVELNLIR